MVIPMVTEISSNHGPGRHDGHVRLTCGQDAEDNDGGWFKDLSLAKASQGMVCLCRLVSPSVGTLPQKLGVRHQTSSGPDSTQEVRHHTSRALGQVEESGTIREAKRVLSLSSLATKRYLTGERSIRGFTQKESEGRQGPQTSIREVFGLARHMVQR